jgi:hypothetical protein
MYVIIFHNNYDSKKRHNAEKNLFLALAKSPHARCNALNVLEKLTESRIH